MKEFLSLLAKSVRKFYGFFNSKSREPARPMIFPAYRQQHLGTKLRILEHAPTTVSISKFDKVSASSFADSLTAYVESLNDEDADEVTVLLMDRVHYVLRHESIPSENLVHLSKRLSMEPTIAGRLSSIHSLLPKFLPAAKDERTDFRLVRISGPAGFGKTSLGHKLLYAMLAHTNVPVFYLPLDSISHWTKVDGRPSFITRLPVLTHVLQDIRARRFSSGPTTVIIEGVSDNLVSVTNILKSYLSDIVRVIPLPAEETVRSTLNKRSESEFLPPEVKDSYARLASSSSRVLKEWINGRVNREIFHGMLSREEALVVSMDHILPAGTQSAWAASPKFGFYSAEKAKFLPDYTPGLDLDAFLVDPSVYWNYVNVNKKS